MRFAYRAFRRVGLTAGCVRLRAAWTEVTAVRRRHAVKAHRRRIEDTEFTRVVAPGRFNVFVRAVDEDRHPIARSNRVRVVVPRPVS